MGKSQILSVIFLIPFLPALLSAQVVKKERPETSRVTLGPKDGGKLPPTDLERVRIGQATPDFTLEDLEGRPVTLSSFRGQKNVVLLFYRGHW